MEDRAHDKKTSGAWVITVRKATEKEDTSKQNCNHQSQRTDDKLRGGGK